MLKEKISEWLFGSKMFVPNIKGTLATIEEGLKKPSNIYCFGCKKQLTKFDLVIGSCDCGMVFKTKT